jgi:methionine synthase I (cobalamin-dependent)
MNRTQYLEHLLSQRLVLLDGAMGTMIQSQGLDADDYTLEGLAKLGCNEVLNLTRGDVIYQIHRDYLNSGADIIETNTFCANAFNLAEYAFLMRWRRLSKLPAKSLVKLRQTMKRVPMAMPLLPEASVLRTDPSPFLPRWKTLPIARATIPDSWRCTASR